MTPHKFCLTEPTLIWITFVCDLLIMAAYYFIPVALLYLYAARPRSKRWTYSIRSYVLVLFAMFIFLCGSTHLLEALTLFFPWYYAEAVVKALTAAASLATVGCLFRRREELVSFPTRVETDYRELVELRQNIALLIHSQ